MIIILEGANGVGKSTYATRLGVRCNLPICRPFRRHVDQHWDEGGDLQEWLDEMRVPVNTHVDDLYVADFLVNFGVGAILDRTMLSAIAYGRVFNSMDGFYDSLSVCQTLFGYWEERIRQADHKALLVFLECDYEQARKRCLDRQFPIKGAYTKLMTMFQKMFQRCNLKKMQVNTGTISAADGVAMVVDTIARM